MGRPKLALPLGGGTVIGRVVAALRAGGVERVLVVAGPHVPELVPLAAAAGADVLALPEPTADMRETVERGLAWIEERHRPGPGDWWLLAPGDSPAITPEVIRQLLAAASDSASVVVPLFEGSRGHPVLLRWSHVQGLRATPRGEGINAYLRSAAADTRALPVSDAGVLTDLDTPDDYARVRQ
jgi:CTP:molybdopterin cytidylyltransferase MocA